MKTLKHSSNMLFIMFILLTLAFACSEDEGVETNDLLSSEEEADLVAAALAENTSGLITSLSDAALVAEEAVDNDISNGRVAGCGFSKDTTFTTTRSTAQLTLSYNFNYGFELTCGATQYITMELNYSGEFDAPRMASANTGTGELEISQLQKAGTAYVINGEYTRSGSFTSKVRNQNTSTSNITLTLTDLNVDKVAVKILSGTATATISGNVEGKGSFTRSGSITFNGDNTATLTIKGEEYIINLTSGEIDA